MSRTNIDLDDEKIARVMQAYGLRTKREAVALALDRLLDEDDVEGGMLGLRGTGWEGDLDELRGPAPVVIVVDTSAWIDLLRDVGTPAQRRLETLLRADEQLAVTEVVVAEVLSGARSEPHRRSLRARLLKHQVLALGGLDGYEAAADLYRAARSAGVTVRYLTDCLIAVPAIRAGASLLHSDRDFDHLARVSALVVEQV